MHIIAGCSFAHFARIEYRFGIYVLPVLFMDDTHLPNSCANQVSMGHVHYAA
jgi:hypothetical protein